jgi:hypothetical protein
MMNFGNIIAVAPQPGNAYSFATETDLSLITGANVLPDHEVASLTSFILAGLLPLANLSRSALKQVYCDCEECDKETESKLKEAKTLEHKLVNDAIKH